jgi:hypothetical protein
MEACAFAILLESGYSRARGRSICSPILPWVKKELSRLDDS